MAIYQVSGGIPRTINVLCDNALIGGFAAQQKPVAVGIIEDVCRDFDLEVRPAVTRLPVRAEPAGADGTGGSSASEQRAPDTAAVPSRAERPMFSSQAQPKRLFSRFW